MQPFFLLACVLAFTRLLGASGQPIEAAEAKLTGAGMIAAIVVAASWWWGQLKRCVRRGEWAGGERWLRHADRVHGLTYLGATAVVFLALDFAEIIHTNLRLGTLFWADDLAVALSLSLPLMAGWVFSAPGANAAQGAGSISPIQYVWLQARHLLLLPLVPMFVLAGIADAQRLWLPDAGQRLSTVLAGLTVAALAVVLPWLLRCCWPVERLSPGPAREVIEATLEASGVQVSEILCWRTQEHWANAAVTGLLPQLRYLFVSDALLNRLSLAELRAITAHEAAHCRLRHLPRLAGSLAILLLILLWAEAFSLAGLNHPTAAPAACAVALLGLWALWHGRWARWLEHQADLAACRQLSGGAISGETVSAYGDALRATAGDSRGDWLHPSFQQRMNLLRCFVGNSAAEAAFERRLRRIDAAQILVSVVGVLGWVSCV